MSDRGPESCDDWPGFDPARGWDLRRESAAEDEDGGGSRPGLDPRVASEFLRCGADGSSEPWDFSMHLRPSDPPCGPLGTSVPTDSPPIRDRPAGSARPYPGPGDELAGFRVIRELGRGAFARVYLAEQLSLAGRQVAVKISTQPVGEESQLLARLQHAHIVPIHSVHEDPASGFHLICMPYLGGSDLARVLEAVTIGSGPASGSRVGGLIRALDRVGGPPPSLPSGETAPRSRGSRSASGGPSGVAEGRGAASGGSASRIRSALDRCRTRIGGRGPDDTSPDGPDEDLDRARPARRFLRRAGPVRASAWIAARLAEGLEHAHSRGLLHRDLKPSNVLITADGMPMILDFNLSALASPDDERDRARLGGTLPYMAPEHLDAFHPRGRTPSRAVDERSDLYSLGLILFEMVAGRPPFRDPPDGPPIAEALDRMIVERLAGPPSARAINPEVPWSLDSLIRKCLEPDPSRRYQAAGDLAEDLRRFLDDRPLRHAPEPSLAERLAKFARRNPQLRSSTTVGLVAAVLLALLIGALLSVRARWESDAARLALGDFMNAFDRCQLLLNVSGEADARRGEQLRRGLAIAREALARYDVDRLGTSWADGPMVRTLHPKDRQLLTERVVELLMLEARAAVAAARDAPEAEYGAALLRALRRLTLAERIDPRPPATLFAERASYAAALGLDEAAERDRRRAASIPLMTARDHALTGTAALANGRLDEAERHLAIAVAIEPRRFWSWFALGLCHLEQGRPGSAAGDFAACLVIDPRSARAHANRGLALAREGRIAEALRCYDEALALDPDLIPARINRALACLELDDPARAALDLRFALDRTGDRDPMLLAAWGEALARSGRRDEADHRFGEALKQRPGDPALLVARGFSRLLDEPAAAREDFERVLERFPGSARAHLGLAHVLRRDDPEGALAHLDAALEAEPDLIDALQLRALVRARLGMRSALSDVDRLRRAPTPHRLYNAASALAILAGADGDGGLRDEALALLGRALEAGFDPQYAASDPDLTPLRDLPGYRALLGPR